MAWVNEELARRFGEIATLLKISGADRFRVRAYERAADTIGAAPVDLGSVDAAELKDVKGIGDSTAKKIVEYLETGTMTMLEELREKVPAGVVELTRVPGLGPKTAVQLHDTLGVDSIEALRTAMADGSVAGLPGLGAKTVANLEESLRRMGAKDTDRVPAADAISLAEEICDRLREREDIAEVTYAGSLRRMRDTIGDIDILVASEGDPAPIHEAFRGFDLVETVIAAGEKKTSVITVRGIQADLRVVEPDAWGAALQYFTGSKAHNVRIRERAVRQGLLLNEYGIFRRELDDDDKPVAGERIASRTEQVVYDAIDMGYVPPTMREDTGEVDAALDGSLPIVVTLADMTGDLHGHSDWSGDGKATLEDMVAAAAARGYVYWAVTDHAEDLAINGITADQVRERREIIRSLQDSYPDMVILDGSELNIGLEGQLDYDPDFLLEFDWTVASVHSGLERDSAAQTERIMRAIQSPAVNAIGHLTGRKVGKRPGFEVDLAAILEACRETGTALEVNASPRRLDLSGEMTRRAVEAGVTLTISCDAHSIGDLDSMRYGVWTAQRGWATPADVLNTGDVERLRGFVQAKRDALG
ncbi:DNA polymerase/3'-5' exonuclease PolX [Euzebya tangerina]|uniref:DNA polymerase/3'-5' exonuclease PolX n=1 Tax=Euzebya tangerina TaxID=591198 RepID=UPI000E320AE8|nr:DNA polymerase/3'-5' exonuclease PolX [Euzebya tangerina]